jgi:type IV pilus assembly protein PilQ
MYCDKKSNIKVKMKRNLFVWCFVLILLTAMAVGDVGQAAAEGGSAAVSKPISGTILSVNFDKDATIRKALRILGAQYEKNIVPSSKVDGLVTVVSLNDVTFEEAMDAILGVNFKYEEIGNLIKVYSADEYKKIKEDKERMVQKVYTLYYVNAAEISKLIKPVLSSSGSIAASTAAAVDTIAGAGGDTLAMHDTIVVYDFPENIEKISKIIWDIDVKPPAILIEVTILEAELKDETEFGVDIKNIAGSSVTSGTSGLSVTGLASGVTGTAGLGAGIAIDDVTAFIRAVESVTDTTVLANPKILALNKQAGHILIGASDGYLTTTQVTTDGRVQEVAFLESGTRLKFRPYICRDGYIRMEIQPEQSQGSVETSANFVLPSKTTTEVSTNIMVKDGKTIVIGGLFKEDTTSSYSQVPVLGDLPVIGPVFRSVHDTSTRKELIILITPHIIDEPEQTEADMRSEDIERLAHGARKKLSWASRARLFEDKFAKAVKDYTEGKYYAALSELNYILEAKPEFLEAIRLKERIIGEVSPGEVDQIERIMLGIIGQEESPKWYRRQ